MIPGVALNLGGKDLIVPPLNFSAVKQMAGKLGDVFSTGIPDMAVVVEAAHFALLRNYPAMTRAEVEDLIDYGNFLQVLEAVMNTSGLVEQLGKMLARFRSLGQTSPE